MMVHINALVLTPKKDTTAHLLVMDGQVHAIYRDHTEILTPQEAWERGYEEEAVLAMRMRGDDPDDDFLPILRMLQALGKDLSSWEIEQLRKADENGKNYWERNLK